MSFTAYYFGTVYFSGGKKIIYASQILKKLLLKLRSHVAREKHPFMVPLPPPPRFFYLLYWRLSASSLVTQFLVHNTL
jgi:hypothetical protein